MEGDEEAVLLSLRNFMLVYFCWNSWYFLNC